jgi:signal transduction histidine kinase
MERAFRPERLAVAEPEPRPLPWWAWAVAAVAIFGTALISVSVIPPDARLAVWWPAGGVSILLGLAAGRDRRWLAVAVVFVATAAANTVAGRDLLPSFFLGLANAAEVLTVTLLLQHRTPRFRLRKVRHARWFMIALGAGALVAGFSAAGIIAAAPGGEGFYTMSYLAVAFHTAASHLSAALLIAPFAVLPPPIAEKPLRAEMILQSALVAGTIAVVFAPDSYLPLSFLPFAFIVWAAFRLPARFALAQALLASIAILTLNLLGGGPFIASALSARELVVVIELYMIVLSVLMTLLVTARNEVWLSTRTALSVSQFVTSGFVASRVGLIVAELRGETLSVLWANDAAAAAIDDELSVGGTWSGPLADNARRSIADGVETMHEDPRTGTTISLVANRIPGDETRISVQLVDVSAAIRMVQARLDAERERAAARSTLADLERQREDFVATTSHELRTPITSIAGYGELLAESPGLTPTERSWVQIIERNTARLLTLVEDLLMLGRSGVPKPRVEPDAEPLALRELAAEVIAVQQPMADARNIALSLEVDPDLRAHCAPDDAGRALGNLVSNAVKFTPPGGTVRIASASHEGKLALVVTDTGPGMSPETLAHAFERFYRGPDAVQESTPGTGLGLAIAAHLAERNGGSVQLASPESGGLAATLVFRDAAERRTDAPASST